MKRHLLVRMIVIIVSEVLVVTIRLLMQAKNRNHKCTLGS